MSEHAHKMVVIGAGPVGLSIAKALKIAGIAYDHIEADDNVGGNWYHGVYKSAHIISSKKTTEYTDWPMPEHYPDFPSGQQMCDYYHAFAREFKLRENLEFETRVTSVVPQSDELWQVQLSSGERRVYKGVIVCNGHHWQKRWPNFIQDFKGEVLHTKNYKTPEQLAGKRVLVVGAGNSGCDVVCEAARVSKEAHLSLRRGYWFLPKTVFGRPLVELIHPKLPVFFQRWILRFVVWMVVGDYAKYGLPHPKHRIFDAHPTLNSELLHYLRHGRITPQKDVEYVEGKVVHFVDGSKLEVDLIVCATGYHVSFPFLAPGLVEVKGPIAQLYAGAMTEHHRHLYIIGTGQPRYGLGPLISAYGPLFCKLINLQDEMSLPLGQVLKKAGQKPPTSHLQDPHQLLRNVRFAHWTIPLLRRIEKSLPKHKHAAPELTASAPSQPFDVY